MPYHKFPPFLKVACREQNPVQHPCMDYAGPDILVFRAPAAAGSSAHARNAVVMSNGKLDWDQPVGPLV